MDPLFSLEGKTAIVTGSTRGIGRAIALAYARAGARVVITSRKADACEAVAAEVAAQGGQAIAVPCNISSKEQIHHLVDETEKAFGAVDVLVCNAAVNPFYGSLSEIPDEAFRKVMDVNILANLWLVNRVTPGMAKRGGGSIVIVSSIAGFSGSRVLGAYAISKAADMQMARNLSLELGKHNIRANCIAPGLVKTDFAKALWDNPDTLKGVLAASPLHMIGEPEDIAGAALLLGSPAGRFITGTTITVDGGAMVRGDV